MACARSPRRRRPEKGDRLVALAPSVAGLSMLRLCRAFRKVPMLKITVVDTQSEQRLVLEGRLAKPDLAELETTWQLARTASGTRRRIVDLRNATFITESAERILLNMQREGAQFVAYGVFTKHRLKQL